MTAEQLSVAADRKRVYPPGVRLRLIRFAAGGPVDDDDNFVSQGTCGEVTFVDDLGTIHMRWDNGRTLGLTLQDQFEHAPPGP